MGAHLLSMHKALGWITVITVNSNSRRHVQSRKSNGLGRQHNEKMLAYYGGDPGVGQL